MSISIFPAHIDDPLRTMALRSPEAVALITPEDMLTYEALDQRVSATSQQFSAIGCEAGDHLAWYLPAGWQSITLLLGAIRAGIVACPLSTRIPPKGIPDLLRRIRTGALITDQARLVELLAGEVKVASYDELIAGSRGGKEAGWSWEMDRPATVVYTSGSSGSPKAVLHSLGNHVFNAMGSNENIALSNGDRWLLALPLYHVGGLGIVFRCLLAGATMVVPEPGLNLAEALTRYRITHVSLVATQLRRLLRERQALPTIKAMLLGGSAIPPSLLAEAHARDWLIHTTYGLTEMASQVTTTPPDATLTQIQSSGQALPYGQMRVDDTGEILVRGATLFQGYLDGEKVQQPFDEDGWFHTGDLGRLDGEGWLHVHGRTDNLFISGGENIQPEEIEQALCAVPGVAQAVVVPVDDAEFGQRPVAFVRWADGSLPFDSLVVELKATLPRFKIPEAFYAWTEGEDGMKIDRAFFREQAHLLRKGK